MSSAKPTGVSLRLMLSASACLLLIVTAWSGLLDRGAEGHYDLMLKRALLTFAAARTLNGIISVAKETEVAIQPAGVGVKLAPGQILDPINDLIEQFSWVMLAAAASLGIQRMLLELSQWVLLNVALSLAALGWLWSLWQGLGAQRLLARILLVLTLLRLAVPGMLLSSELVHWLIVDRAYQGATAELEQAKSGLTALHEQDGGLVEADDKVGPTRWLSQAGDWLRIGERVQAYQAQAGRLAESVVQLIAVFVLQTMLLPLLFLWALLRLARQLW